MVLVKSLVVLVLLRLSSIDWDDFYLTTINVSGETAPYTQRINIYYIRRLDRYLRDSENDDDADTQQYGEPKYIIRSPDHRKFGLSPIPDKVYNVHFYAYTAPTLYQLIVMK